MLGTKPINYSHFDYVTLIAAIITKVSCRKERVFMTV